MLPQFIVVWLQSQGDVGAKRSSKESHGTSPGADRKLAPAMQSWQSRMSDAARLRAQVNGPQFSLLRGILGV